MSSPLFRTLQIGTLRYRGEVVIVQDTQIITDVILTLDEYENELALVDQSTVLSFDDNQTMILNVDETVLTVQNNEKTIVSC